MSADVSFLDAMKSRYSAADDTRSYGPSAFLVGRPVPGGPEKTWEMVGMDTTREKQSCFRKLLTVVLRAEGITVAVKASERRPDASEQQHPGSDAAQPAAAFPDDLAAERMVALRELDLSENTALPLAEVGKLLPYFPRLHTLQLSDMPSLLALPSRPTSPLLASVALQKLVLNNTGFVSMAQLRPLLAVPALEELHLDFNSLETLDLGVATADDEGDGTASAYALPSVSTLSLAYNKLHDWDALGTALLRAFPALKQLFLGSNEMPNLQLPASVIEQDAKQRLQQQQQQQRQKPPEDAEESPVGIPPSYAFLARLTLLCVNDNPTLTDPCTVDAVRILAPALQTFRITYSQLLPRWNDTLSRMYVVAALPSIQTLNRAQVRPKERMDSEIFYIQRGLAQRHVDGEKNGSSAGEPTYALLDLLHDKHKEVVISIYREGATASSDGSAHLMLSVRLRCENLCTAGSHEGEGSSSALREVETTLPSNLSIRNLKALLRKEFQIDLPNQLISFRSGDDGVLERPVELEDEQQTLGFYGVSNGAIISVRDTSLRD